MRQKERRVTRKLAQRINKDKRPEALIETRGEGGYFAAGTNTGVYRNQKRHYKDRQGYLKLRGPFLIDNAVSLNEFYPVIRTEYEKSKDRPGDLFNDDP